jgi:hypothetical protein
MHDHDSWLWLKNLLNVAFYHTFSAMKIKIGIDKVKELTIK